jgi:hypothetical protein
MKVKELKALIAFVADDVEVVISGYDHSYAKADARVVNAEYHADTRDYYEYFDDASREPGTEVKPVLVVR